MSMHRKKVLGRHYGARSAVAIQMGAWVASPSARNESVAAFRQGGNYAELF